VATVTLPALSRTATDGVTDDFRSTLSKGLRLVAFLVLPSSLGLILLADPIVSLLYERGAFDAQDRLQTAAALRAYAYGLLGYAWLKVLQPAFYAVDKRWLPMMVSILALVLNLAFNWFFVFVMRWGHESLALTTSISATVNFLILFIAMRRFAGDIGGGELISLLGKLSLAAVAMSLVCIAANHWLFPDPGKLSMWHRALWLMLTIGAAQLAYFSIASLMKVTEAKEAIAMVMRKLRG
jgi:putative peptidoglycan lipid II flippase